MTGRRSACHSAESLLFMNIIAWGPQLKACTIGLKESLFCSSIYIGPFKKQLFMDQTNTIQFTFRIRTCNVHCKIFESKETLFFDLEAKATYFNIHNLVF